MKFVQISKSCHFCQLTGHNFRSLSPLVFLCSEISCRTLEGLDGLRQLIYHITCNMKDVGSCICSQRLVGRLVCVFLCSGRLHWLLLGVSSSRRNVWWEHCWTSLISVSVLSHICNILEMCNWILSPCSPAQEYSYDAIQIYQGCISISGPLCLFQHNRHNLGFQSEIFYVPFLQHQLALDSLIWGIILKCIAKSTSLDGFRKGLQMHNVSNFLVLTGILHLGLKFPVSSLATSKIILHTFV